jgi:hypothetical protein
MGRYNTYPLSLHILTYLPTYLLTYLLHGAVFLEKPTGFQLVKKSSSFLWNPKVHYRSHKCPPHVPIHQSISPGPRLTLWLFRNTMRILRWGIVSTSPNPPSWKPPPVGCPRLLIQYICTYPPYRRPFLHAQPEDVPCSGDRDPLTYGFRNVMLVWSAGC